MSPRPIRIAYVIDALYAPAGGTEGQLLHLLNRMDRERFEPKVFCLRDAEPPMPGNVVLDLHLSASPATLARIWNFSRILRDGDFDIVQTHFRDANIVGVLAAWLARTPVIISTRRGVPYWEQSSGLRFLRWLNGRVTWFIANSEATRQRYATAEGFDPARVDVIYNGLEPERFTGLDPGNRRRLREDLGLADHDLVVGIVANLRPVKGLRDFVEAAARVAAEIPQARFVVVGRGPEESKLRELAESLGIGSKMRFAGARPDVPDLLQAFDVGVLASHFESFSNSVLEYIAAGLPVVVTDVGGVREAVEEGRQGFIVPAHAPDIMADRLRTLLAHEGGPRAWRTENGIDRKFEVGAMVEGHQRLYARLAPR